MEKKRKKILIVDDERSFLEVLQMSLENTDKYEVVIENDASQALNAATRHRPDLILLDIIMAKKEGPDVAIELNNDPALKDIPVVFLTATVTQREVDAAGGRIAGHDFVAKPSSFEALLEIIERKTIAV